MSLAPSRRHRNELTACAQSAKPAPAAAAEGQPKESLLSLLVNNVLTNPYIWGMALTYFFIYVVRQGVTSWFVFYLIKVPPCTHTCAVTGSLGASELPVPRQLMFLLRAPGVGSMRSVRCCNKADPREVSMSMSSGSPCIRLPNISAASSSSLVSDLGSSLRPGFACPSLISRHCSWACSKLSPFANALCQQHAFT